HVWILLVHHMRSVKILLKRALRDISYFQLAVLNFFSYRLSSINNFRSSSVGKSKIPKITVIIRCSFLNIRDGFLQTFRQKIYPADNLYMNLVSMYALVFQQFTESLLRNLHNLFHLLRFPRKILSGKCVKSHVLKANQV